MSFVLSSSSLFNPRGHVSPGLNNVTEVILLHDTLRPITVLVLDSLIVHIVVLNGLVGL